jgi:hypothetical protein
MHTDMALTAACLPAMQSTQVTALVAAVAFDALPAAQLVHEVAALVAFVCLPAGHALHVVAAVVLEY